jgi:hypothetical protein
MTPDIKRKQNNFFWNFWNIGLVLVTLINWLLKPKCMLIHIFKIFFVIWKYNMNFFYYYYYLETWPYAWKQKHSFMSWQKLGILIPDLYIYNIKIQIDIDQNAVKNIRENHKFLKKNLEFFFGLGPARPMWLGWTQLVSTRKRAWTIHARLL